MAEDKIIIEYGAKIDSLEKDLETLEKELKKVDKASNASIGDMEKDANKSAKAIDKNTKEVKTLSGELGKLASNLPFASQLKQVNDFGSAILGVGNSAGKTSSIFKILKVAIASTGIGLLVVAIAGLIAYFKRTDEGATRLSGVMSAMGAVLDRITGSFIDVGEAVYTAFNSFENFNKGIKDLGVAIQENLINRLKAPLVLFDALGLAFKEFKENGINGNFFPAIKKAQDSLLQLELGIENGTDKIGNFIDEAAKAAAAAYEWEKRMDALQDKIREDSKTISENEKNITRLVVASKNKQIADEKSLALLQEAAKLEKANLKTITDNEQARLKLIQERNKRESDSINQGRKAGQERLSINDELAQEEVDQINKINKLQEDSFRLQEKINNMIDSRKEEIFQNKLKRLSQEEVAEETAAKERFLNQTISAQELEDELFNIKLKGLESQRELLVKSGRETIEIDKTITDLRIAQALKDGKDLEDAKKEDKSIREKNFQNELSDIKNSYKEKSSELKSQYSQGRINENRYNKDLREIKIDSLNEEKKLLKIYGKDTADITNAINDEEIAKEKEKRDKIRAIVSSSVDVLKNLIDGFYANSREKRQNDLAEEQKKLEDETNSRIKALDTQLKEGIISQDQYNAKKLAIEQKQKNEEAKLKRKAFEADKRAALTQVAIDTAAAIVKAIAATPLPAGAVLAALAAATGAAQAAIIASKPVPKFKSGVIDLKGKGTGTSDSIPARLSKGESVMTAEETKEHKPLFKAIRDGDLDSYINNSYVMPALRAIEVRNALKREGKIGANEIKLNAILERLNFDTSNLERVVKSNKSVGISNSKQLARDIGNEISLKSNWYK